MDLKRCLAGLLFVTAGVPISAQTIPYQDVAVVVSKQPRFATMYQQVCTQVPVERRSSGGSGVVGAIVGAAIGNQIGGGSGRDIATAAGAVIGAQIGSQNDSTTVEMQNRCSSQPVQYQQGEIVTFEYRGRRFTQVFNN